MTLWSEGRGTRTLSLAVTQPRRPVSQRLLPALFRRQFSNQRTWLAWQPRPVRLSCQASSADPFGSLRGFLTVPRSHAPGWIRAGSVRFPH